YCKADGSPLCVPAKGDVVKACSEAQKSQGAVDCFKASTTDKLPAGKTLAADWEDFRKKFWDKCMKPNPAEAETKTFRKLFCTNCIRFAKAVGELNKRVNRKMCDDITGGNLD